MNAIRKLIVPSQNIYLSRLRSPFIPPDNVCRDFCCAQIVRYCSQDTWKGLYSKNSGIVQKIRETPTILTQSVMLLRDEFINMRENNRKELVKTTQFKEEGEIDMLYTFENEECINKFSVSTDSSASIGFSSATFSCTQYGTGLFTGFIDTTVPKDGKTNYTGYANLKSKTRRGIFGKHVYYQWYCYSHLVFKVRGDGRTYVILLYTPGNLDIDEHDQYHYPLYTRGGPYWQVSKIPFSNFIFTSRGICQDEQELMSRVSCNSVGITLADGNKGPFKLEIDYIGLEYQPTHKIICPYEAYN